MNIKAMVTDIIGYGAVHLALHYMIPAFGGVNLLSTAGSTVGFVTVSALIGRYKKGE